MKRFFPIIIFLIAIAFTGCLQLTELTDEEEDKLAQAAAGILLNHDKKYNEKLATPTPTKILTPTPSPTNTPTPTEVPENPTPTAGESTDPEPTKKPSKDENAQSFAELKEVIGNEYISLHYGGYDLYDNYTFKTYSIEASSPDKQLMIVKIIVQNDSTARTYFKNNSKELSYKLYIDDKKTVSANMSILMNDFMTLEVTLDPGDRFESVLVFEVERNITANSLNLFITKGEKTVVVKLK